MYNGKTCENNVPWILRILQSSRCHFGVKWMSASIILKEEIQDLTEEL